jgi:hypothetical protein
MRRDQSARPAGLLCGSGGLEVRLLPLNPTSIGRALLYSAVADWFSFLPRSSQAVARLGEQTVNATRHVQLRLDLGQQHRRHHRGPQLARPGTLLASYVEAARLMLHGDAGRAWTPQELRAVGAARGLLATPVSDDLFKKALGRLCEAREVTRVAPAFYRSGSLVPVGTVTPVAKQYK